MALVAKDVIDDAAEIAQDTNMGRITEFQWISWLNDAQRAISVHKPDANTKIESMLLANETKQALPATARRLQSVIRNMGADGLTPGRAVRGPVLRSDMDDYDFDWHTTTGAAILQYSYNVNTPDVFWVLPKPTGTLYVEIEVAKPPTQIVNVIDAITINDIYAPALVEWMLYKGFARSSEESPNFQRAQFHLENCMVMLGVKSQTDLEVHPQAVRADA